MLDTYIYIYDIYIYIYMCFAKGSHMFSHALHICCAYTLHTHYIRFIHVNVYVSYASGAQLTYVSHAVYICFACVKQLGYVYVPLVRFF